MISLKMKRLKRPISVIRRKKMSLENSINKLKSIVKFSDVKGQKHIDLTLVDAGQRVEYQKALAEVNIAVKKGELTEDELKQRLGLI